MGADARGATAGWTENRPPRGLAGLNLAELWAYRELLGFLALRDVKVRYKQAVFGVAWAVLAPLAGVAVFTVVFDRLAGVPSDGIPYPVFAFVSYSVWTYFAGAVNASTSSLVGNASLVTKVYFPRIAAPVASVLPGLIDLTVAFVFLAAFMAYYRVTPGLGLVTLPLWMAAAAAVALGVGLWLSTLNVQFRDVHHAIGLLVQLWLFASPVGYPSSMIQGAWRWLYALNPMAGILDGFRWALVGGPPPGAPAFLSASSAAALLAGGVWFFQRAERRFADVI